MNESYNVEIEVLTPIHIGDGTTIYGIDYFCYQEELKPPYKQTDDGKDIKNKSFLYKYKINDFKKILDEKDKQELEKLFLLGTDTIEIRNFIYTKLEKEKHKNKNKFLEISKEKIEIKNSFYNNWKDKILLKLKQSYGKIQEKREAEFTNQLSQLEIKSFIKSLGRYYIPGSSLKGTIRTVLTNKNIDAIEYEYFDKKTSKNIKLYKKIDTEKDPFKKLIVRDTSFINDGIEIGALSRKGGIKKGDGTYAEYIKIGTILKTEILFKNFINENSLEKIDITKEVIIKKSNEYLKRKIKKYIEDLVGLKNLSGINEKKILKIDSTINSFNKILSKISELNENECILNIGFGGGYWFKSFEGNEKHPNDKGIKNLIDDNLQIPRTNNTIDLENLGFIKLTFKN